MKRQLLSSITIMLAGISSPALADSGSDISVESTDGERVEISSEADGVDRRSRRRSGQQRAGNGGQQGAGNGGHQGAGNGGHQGQNGPVHNNQGAQPNNGSVAPSGPMQPPTPPTPGGQSSGHQSPNGNNAGHQGNGGHQGSGGHQGNGGHQGRNANTTASNSRPAHMGGRSNGRHNSSSARVPNRQPSTSHRPAPRNRGVTSRAPARVNHARTNRARHLPRRWAPNYHRYHMRGVPRHHPRYWSAGVFYYNPPPQRNRTVVVHDHGNVSQAPEPTRAIDRNNSFGVGISAGSYNSGYETGGEYGDMGIGLTATYRPVEAVGFEIAWTHYDQSWDETSERIQEPVQASVSLYAFPWTRVSPYLTVGVTQTGRDVQDEWFDGFSQQTTTTQQTVFGPHAGLGVEFAMGSMAALDLEARYINYLDMSPNDASASDALQGTMGLKFYF